jgi:hypothetical protein
MPIGHNANGKDSLCETCLAAAQSARSESSQTKGASCLAVVLIGKGAGKVRLRATRDSSSAPALSSSAMPRANNTELGSNGGCLRSWAAKRGALGLGSFPWQNAAFFRVARATCSR